MIDLPRGPRVCPTQGKTASYSVVKTDCLKAFKTRQTAVSARILVVFKSLGLFRQTIWLASDERVDPLDWISDEPISSGFGSVLTIYGD